MRSNEASSTCHQDPLLVFVSSKLCLWECLWWQSRLQLLQLILKLFDLLLSLVKLIEIILYNLYFCLINNFVNILWLYNNIVEQNTGNTGVNITFVNVEMITNLKVLTRQTPPKRSLILREWIIATITNSYVVQSLELLSSVFSKLESTCGSCLNEEHNQLVLSSHLTECAGHNMMLYLACTFTYHHQHQLTRVNVNSFLIIASLIRLWNINHSPIILEF